MVHNWIERFLEHPKRKLLMVGMTTLFCLFFVLPAWDHYSNARDSVAQYKTELHEISFSLANRELLNRKLQEFDSNQTVSSKTIDANRAEKFRENVTKLTHEMGCRVRRLTMSDPLVRSWRDGDSPFGLNSQGSEEESSFQLETRSLRLSAGGNLTQLTGLLTELTRLDRFAVPANMTLQRQGIDGHLILDVEISLFNLVGTFD